MVKNHAEKVCKTKKQNYHNTHHRSKVNQITEAEIDKNEDWLYQIKDKKSVRCKMEVNNKPIRFHIDTGASVNMIPRHFIKSDIRPYKGILSMWNNTVVKPAGITTETIHNPKNRKNYRIDCVVFNDKELDCAPILGLSSSEKRNFKVQHTNFVKRIQIMNYDTVFSNGLGELPGLPSLTVDKRTKSFIMAYRRTPVALRSKLSLN